MSKHKYVTVDSALVGSTGPLERNSCTVIALALATGSPFAAASEELRKDGRKPGRKFAWGSWVAWKARECERVLGHRIWTTDDFWMEKLKPTVAQVLEKYKSRKGRFVVRIKAHVFTIVDGVVYDPLPIKPRARVHAVHEFILDK